LIITQTPLRISLGGGGSDLPSYYRANGGYCITASINKYVFIGLNPTFDQKYLIKYAKLERHDNAFDIEHPIVREALIAHNPGPVEVVSMADVPAGTGLGSSGAFTVGLLRALYAFRREVVSMSALAEEACDIEINRLGEPVGKQDQYAAALGGITEMEIGLDGRVNASSVPIGAAALRELQDRLLMFYTGVTRPASLVLADQVARSVQGDRVMIGNLDEIVAIGREVGAAIRAGNLKRFGQLMHAHWEVKRVRSPGISDGAIDDHYRAALQSGAVGGKLVGAGGGGFLMFVADDPGRLRGALTARGLSEMSFSLDFEGSIVLVRGE